MRSCPTRTSWARRRKRWSRRSGRGATSPPPRSNASPRGWSPSVTDPLDDLRQVETELNTRWGETKIEPTLQRIGALVDLLGDPHKSYPIVHVAGTNGKTSVTRMIDALLTRIGLRTGRYTSPHLQLVTERIALDGAPISPSRYVEVYRDIEPYVSIVDGASEIPMSKFEVLAGMAYAAFADTPVDAAVVEVGLGGTWDATNVVDAKIGRASCRER